MAPQNNLGKRVKGTSVHRPFIYGTTAKPFDDEKNPKPPGVPDDHTHSWQVFVKGVEDTDVTYWLKRVQFKLHESIPNHIRMVDSEPGKPFVVNETGWGEFEIAIKLYYVPESGEKPQTLYHHLRLHPYGRTDAEKDAMRASGEVTAWTYEEQIFNEPYEVFYDVLTSGALATTAAANRGKGKGSAPAVGGVRTEGGVLERSAMIPLSNRPGQPFSRDTEQLEVERLKKAQEKAQALMSTLQTQLKNKEAALQKLRKQTASAK
ncbi:hypothetical protein PspLS_02149 [Pyricularia sp. CBS 133598]|nr:hypothetical protein PspLS_02149 [Pyricularia sp. CBS 133598]